MSGDATVSAFPAGDNLFEWVATIVGGTGTVYDSLKFKLSLSFPSRYPYSAPVVKFTTPCYHPNVDGDGNICLDILKVLHVHTHSDTVGIVMHKVVPPKTHPPMDWLLLPKQVRGDGVLAAKRCLPLL